MTTNTDMGEILEKISNDSKIKVENNHLTEDVNIVLDEYKENQFKIVFRLADIREQKSAMKGITGNIEETNIVIDGDIWKPEVQIYQISDNICNMKISVKTNNLD
jgi:hypothetical protein